jgi:hypothetical protein
MNSGQFEKGLTPWNKGLKGVNGESENRFKKGNETWNTRPLGDEHIDNDGYIRVKVAETGTKRERWKLKHRLIYMEHHGEIPSRIIVRFLDNDMRNMAIDNLFAVTRAENVILNRIKFSIEPIELKPTILSVVRMCLKSKTPYTIKI